MRQWLAGLAEKFRRWGARRPAVRRRPALECLEDRLVPVTIVWANADKDAGFGMFGPQLALQARGAVQQAIIDWENVIVSFGGKNANFPKDVVKLKVFVQPGSVSHGGFQKLPDGTTGFGVILGFDTSKPAGGSAPVGGWYLSPNPASNSEFMADPRDTLFAGTIAPSKGSDFLSAALHEVGHILGALTVNPASPFLTPTGTSVPDAAGTPVPLYLFHFPNGVTVPLMEPDWVGGAPTGVGHLFLGTVQTPLAGTVTGRLDALNPTRQDGERTLITDIDAFILEDALGYQINVPSQMNWTIGNPAPPAPAAAHLHSLALHPPVRFPHLRHPDVGP